MTEDILLKLGDRVHLKGLYTTHSKDGSPLSFKIKRIEWDDMGEKQLSYYLEGPAGEIWVSRSGIISTEEITALMLMGKWGKSVDADRIM